jgi:hypothetical protein
MIRKITAAYIRKHTDNGQTVAYVEWMDHKGRARAGDERTAAP